MQLEEEQPDVRHAHEDWLKEGTHAESAQDGDSLNISTIFPTEPEDEKVDSPAKFRTSPAVKDEVPGGSRESKWGGRSYPGDNVGQVIDGGLMRYEGDDEPVDAPIFKSRKSTRASRGLKSKEKNHLRYSREEADILEKIAIATSGSSGEKSFMRKKREQKDRDQSTSVPPVVHRPRRSRDGRGQERAAERRSSRAAHATTRNAGLMDFDSALMTLEDSLQN